MCIYSHVSMTNICLHVFKVMYYCTFTKEGCVYECLCGYRCLVFYYKAYSTNLFQVGCVCTCLCNVDCTYLDILSLHNVHYYT